MNDKVKAAFGEVWRGYKDSHKWVWSKFKWCLHWGVDKISTDEEKKSWCARYKARVKDSNKK